MFQNSKDLLLNQFVNESLILVQIHGKDSPKSQQSSSGSSNLSVKNEEEVAGPSCVKKESQDGEETLCQRLLETIRNVRKNSDPCPWSVCICTIKNSTSMGNKDPSDRVTCATIKSNMSMVAAGYESNYLRIIPFHREERGYSSRRNGLKRSDSHFSFYLKSSPLFACLEEEQAMKEAQSEPETGSESKTGSEPETGSEPSRKVDGNILRGHTKPITGLSFIPDSKHLLSSSRDSTVRCWNLTKCTCDAIYSAGDLPNHSVWSLDSSPLGVYFATGSSDTMAKLWSPEYLHPLRLFVGHTSDVNVVRFHPNCRYLATGSSDSTVKMWSVSDGKCVRSLSSGSTKSCCSVTTALSFSPNGHLLLSSGIDGIIRLWDLRMSKLLKSYRGHRDTVNHVSFNLDGSIVSSTSFDQTIKLWPVESSGSTQSHAYHSSCDQQQASNETIRFVDSSF